MTRIYLHRADLWAFAAKVAIEFTTEQNNYQCEDNPPDWFKKKNSWVGKAKDCMRNKGEEDCRVTFPQEIR